MMAYSNVQEVVNIMEKVSVVIPAYKAENTIIKAVKSALQQGGCVKEVIVVIDGVFDKTCDALKSIEDARLNVIIFHQNKGAQIARNKGLSLASSEYIIFLDSDDYFEGGFIIGLLATLVKTDANFCIGKNCRVYSDGKKSYFNVNDNFNNIDVLKGWILGTCAVGPTCILWQKNIINSIGGWDEKVVRNQDGDLVIRAIVNGAEPCFSKIGAGCTVQHDGHRISRLRTKESFMEQSGIYQSVSTYLEVFKGDTNTRKQIKAALNYFCINICIGMAQSGFKGDNYVVWKNRIDWKISHFFQLPKSKSLLALIFFVFGRNAFIVKKILKKLS